MFGRDIDENSIRRTPFPFQCVRVRYSLSFVTSELGLVLRQPLHCCIWYRVMFDRFITAHIAAFQSLKPDSCHDANFLLSWYQFCHGANLVVTGSTRCCHGNRPVPPVTEKLVFWHLSVFSSECKSSLFLDQYAAFYNWNYPFLFVHLRIITLLSFNFHHIQIIASYRWLVIKTLRLFFFCGLC